MESNNEYLVKVNDLEVQYTSKDIGVCRAVNGISFDIRKGETLGLVGETGAGKTTVAMSLLGLVPSPPGKIVKGEIFFNGKDLRKASRAEMKKIRGKELSMIFQNPMTALNPVLSVGEQIEEVIFLHSKISKQEAMQKASDMMEMVGITPERYKEFPHQFSGGMKQRIVIAMALACSPELLIADEPTTALDVTIQAQVLNMMNDLKKTMGTSILLITHDLGVVAAMCQKVGVMYAGVMVEYGSAEDIFDRTSHPYTIGLFDSLPSLDRNDKRLKPIKGMMPDPTRLPEGCKFSPRCEFCTERCRKEEPPVYEVSPGHLVRCFRAEEMMKGGE